MFYLVMFHFMTGAIALLAGYSVIICKKGEASHRILGRIYVVSMLLLGLTGTIVALEREVPLSMMNGLVLCYFVLSALNIIWQPANRSNSYDKLLLLFAAMLTMGFAWFSYQTTQNHDGKLGGFGIAAYIAFGSVMAFCTIADYRYVKRGGLSGSSRLVRHLWRMFFPLFMSTAAFFLGQSKHLPQALQQIEFVLAPVVLVILAAIYWIIKVSMTMHPGRLVSAGDSGIHRVYQAKAHWLIGKIYKIRGQEVQAANSLQAMTQSLDKSNILSRSER